MQRDRQTETHTERQMTETHIDRPRQTDRETDDRDPYRDTNRETDRQEAHRDRQIKV